MIINPEPARYSIGKFTIVGLLAALYAVMYVILLTHIDYGGAPFASATVIAAGWFFGIRGGVITSLLLCSENVLLLRLFGDLGGLEIVKHGNVAGMMALILIGIAVGHMSDLSLQVKASTKLLRHQAFHDPLTNLPNRALFYDRLEHAAARVTRGTGSIAILFLDLDGFKQINDRYGHMTGDKLLAAVAKRLQSALRTSDTIARLGGDEFVIMLEDLADIEAARMTAERLVRQLEIPFSIEGIEASITSSIGIAFRATDIRRPEDLLLDADRAMYQAKTSGKARYQVFQPEPARTAPTAMEPRPAAGD